MDSQKPRSRTKLAVSIVLVVVIGASLIGAAYLRTNSPSVNKSTSATASRSTSSQSASASTNSAQSANGTAPSISSVVVADITIDDLLFPEEMAVNPNTNMVYVADDTLNKLAAVDLANHSVIATITLPGTASPGAGIGIDTATNMVYVPVWGCTAALGVENSCFNGGVPRDGGVVAINGTTDTITAEYHFDTFAGFAVDSNTGVLFGVYGEQTANSNSTTGSLLEINGASGSLVANVSLGALPLSVAINPETNMAYVLACKEFSSNCAGTELLTVNGTSGSLQSVTPLSYGESPFNMVVDPLTNVVYAVMVGPQNLTLLAIDGTSGSVDYSKPLDQSCAAYAGALAIDTASGLIYASAGGCLLVITASTGLIANVLSAPSQQLQYVAFNPVASQVYATTGGASVNFAGSGFGHLLVLPGALNLAA